MQGIGKKGFCVESLDSEGLEGVTFMERGPTLLGTPCLGCPGQFSLDTAGSVGHTKTWELTLLYPLASACKEV